MALMTYAKFISTTPNAIYGIFLLQSVLALNLRLVWPDEFLMIQHDLLWIFRIFEFDIHDYLFIQVDCPLGFRTLEHSKLLKKSITISDYIKL